MVTTRPPLCIATVLQIVVKTCRKFQEPNQETTRLSLWLKHLHESQEGARPNHSKPAIQDSLCLLDQKEAIVAWDGVV